MNFDWECDSDAIVVQEQAAIAVYENGNGDVVIRQRTEHTEDDDVVYVHAKNLPTLIDALKARLEEAD
ncbi:MAG: hypothetical protein GY788_17310 [bacterium]|nr:hypothetical protein [bacterium]